MNEEQWKIVNDMSFEEIRYFLNELENGLKNENGETVHHFIKPISRMLCEANRDVLAFKRDRQKEGDDILNSIK